jgi:hypothetical protein
MKLILVVIVSALTMIGCSVSKVPSTPIVQKAEECGAGPLEGASIATVQDWFGKHRDCAVAVDALCKPVRESAAAKWAESTEGRVCMAARSIAQWVRKPSDDHEKFQSGWK